VSDDNDKRPVLELRNALTAEVSFPERTITLLAAPYEQPTPEDRPIMYRGKYYTEVFSRGAFDGVEQRSNQIRVNREHRKGDTIGKVVRLDNTTEGLIAEVRVVNSPSGDEALALASEDMISPSVGFGVRNSDQDFDRSTRPHPTRYVRRAFLDHIGLVEDPAYTSAGVLSVRGQDDFVNAADLPSLNTPKLDEWAAYLQSRRVGVAS
jgi:HK97 family phage prohead protease